MNGMLDTYLGTILKNWASQRQPSRRLRARLLWLAAYPAMPVENKTWWGDTRNTDTILQTRSNDCIDWSIVYSPLIGMKGLRLIT